MVMHWAVRQRTSDTWYNKGLSIQDHPFKGQDKDGVMALGTSRGTPLPRLKDRGGAGLIVRRGMPNRSLDIPGKTALHFSTFHLHFMGVSLHLVRTSTAPSFLLYLEKVRLMENTELGVLGSLGAKKEGRKVQEIGLQMAYPVLQAP